MLSDQFQEGGCNSFRTIDDTNRSHEQLIEKHPKYVKWSGKTKKVMGKEMKKVRVSWGQAYKDNSPIIHGSRKLI